MSETRIPERDATSFFQDYLRLPSHHVRNSHIYGFNTFFQKRLPTVLSDLGYDVDRVTEKKQVPVERKVIGVNVDGTEVVDIEFLKITPALKSSVLSFFGIGYGAACAFFLSPFALGGVFLGVLGVLLNLYKNHEVLSKDDPVTQNLLLVFLEIGKIIIDKGKTAPVATLDDLEERLGDRFHRTAIQAIIDNLIIRGLIAHHDKEPCGYVYASATIDDIHAYVSDVYGPDVEPEALEASP